MNSLRTMFEHLRARHRCELQHKKVLKHVNHGFHTAYLGWYVIDWHLPVSVICLPLLAIAVLSWLFHLELE